MIVLHGFVFWAPAIVCPALESTYELFPNRKQNDLLYLEAVFDRFLLKK